MNEQLKKRLVGAIVLVALAVIFVPMLLEGDKRAGIPLFGSNVPEPPESPIATIDIPLQVPPRPASAPVVVEREPVAEPSESAPAAPTPVPPVPTVQPASPAAPAAVVTAPAPASVAQPKPSAPVQQAVMPPATKPAAAASWAVQVGSFAEAANASRLRDSLRGKGYPAYVEQVKLNGGSSYRVRVGPVLSRSDAEAIQVKLVANDLRGIVVPHP